MFVILSLNLDDEGGDEIGEDGEELQEIREFRVLGAVGVHFGVSCDSVIFSCGYW